MLCRIWCSNSGDYGQVYLLGTQLATCFHAGFLPGLSLDPWRLRHYVLQKRRLSFNGLHDVISKDRELFMAILFKIFGSFPKSLKSRVEILCKRHRNRFLQNTPDSTVVVILHSHIQPRRSYTYLYINNKLPSTSFLSIFVVLFFIIFPSYFSISYLSTDCAFIIHTRSTFFRRGLFHSSTACLIRPH
jgi:hypothetical protein